MTAGRSRLVELSHTIHEAMTTYPGIPGPTLGSHLTFEESHDRYEAGTEVSMGTIDLVGNTGTYLDTPAHRWRDGHDLAGLALERCALLPALVVDAPAQGAADEAVLAALETHGSAARGAALLVRTGWDAHFGTERYGSTDHPHLLEPVCHALVEAGVALVGIDSVNIDGTHTGARPAHSVLLRAEVYVVEHLTGLDALPATGATFTAVPPRIEGLATFPVRAFAQVPG